MLFYKYISTLLKHLSKGIQDTLQFTVYNPDGQASANKKANITKSNIKMVGT